jgi:SpoVK/Ycf46/Vps4 family AAA+-type ATPase
MKVSQWADQEGQFSPVGATIPKLEPGVYNIAIIESMFGESWSLVKVEPKHDKILKVGIADYLYHQMTAFMEAKPLYEKFELLHKRGFLLHGLPGCGKSMAAVMACQMAAKNGGISVLASYPHFTLTALQAIRAIQPNTLITVLWEDIDKYASVGMDNDSYRQVLTSMLDGENQIDSVIHIATTNYFANLDPAYINRPRRFDEVIEMTPPDLDTRMTYLTLLAKDDGTPEYKTKIGDIAKASEGMMLSHLSEFIIGVFILNHSADSVASRLKGMAIESGKAIAKRSRKAGLAIPSWLAPAVPNGEGGYLKINSPDSIT